MAAGVFMAPRGVRYWLLGVSGESTVHAARDGYQLTANGSPASLASVQRTGGELVLDSLKAAGVDTVFGIISVHNIPIFDAIAREGGVRLVPARTEHGAAAMADGFARSSGKLAAVITSTGVGAANAAGPLLEAFVASSRVLHITGQV